jgi:adenosine deaminase
MFSHFGFTVAELKQFMLNGIDGAWVDDTTKAAWRAAWAPEFDVLAATLAAG